MLALSPDGASEYPRRLRLSTGSAFTADLASGKLEAMVTASAATTTDTILHVVQAAAIIAAAIWGYYKFVRGRTFHRRAELEVTAALLAIDNERAIRARIVVKNTGATDIPMRTKALYVYSVDQADWDAPLEWKEVVAVSVFNDHEWVESQETISDETLVPLPIPGEDAPAPRAYKVECRIYDQRRKPGAIRWTSNAIVSVAEVP